MNQNLQRSDDIETYDDGGVISHQIYKNQHLQRYEGLYLEVKFVTEVTYHGEVCERLKTM